ncbi:putative inorganic phosphate cotransporter [Amyelois transitella]|uniref:putative inorganic phosphate cotransporter n=1 Tax=Amyelois transitella TaxID=680683 RepID=UPI0029903383|nr:putative inorganic phosphate cotransporter [Amyelois transitella]
MAQTLNSAYEKVPVIDTGESETKPIKDEEPSYGYGVRHVQSLLFFTSLLIGYLARAHLGVSIVAMTYYVPSINDNTSIDLRNITLHLDRNTTSDDNYTSIYDTSEDINHVANNNSENIFEEMENVTSDEYGIYKKYIWSKPVQEMILISFFLGYCIMQYGMSMIAQRWGGKLPLQIGLFVNGLASIVTPWFAFWGGWKAVCACRILQGMSQGGFYPSIQTLLAQWVPPKELARLSSFVYTGPVLGTIIAFQLGGVLSASPWGWPSIFWGTGILCLLAFVMLTVFGAATPHEHKTISEEERRFITHTMSNISKKKPSVPLKAALSSKHTWALFTTHIGSQGAYMFVFMQVPSYIHYSLGVNVKDSGLFSSLPYVAGFFTSIFYGVLSDFLTNRNILSVKNARRTFNTISTVGTAVCLVAVSYTEDVSLAVLLLVVQQATHVGIHSGWMVNYIDLTSNFSGAILAFGNTLTHVFALGLPVLVSNIVVDVSNRTQWRVMFYLMAGFALVTNAIFVAFMSAERQPWDDTHYQKTEADETVVEKCGEADSDDHS